MLELLEHLLESGAIRFRQDFLDAIGMKKQNFRQITLGKQDFTLYQISNAIVHYSVNVKWLFGLEKKMFK